MTFSARSMACVVRYRGVRSHSTNTKNSRRTQLSTYPNMGKPFSCSQQMPFHLCLFAKHFESISGLYETTRIQLYRDDSWYQRAREAQNVQQDPRNLHIHDRNFRSHTSYDVARVNDISEHHHSSLLPSLLARLPASCPWVSPVMSGVAQLTHAS